VCKTVVRKFIWVFIQDIVRTKKALQHRKVQVEVIYRGASRKVQVEVIYRAANRKVQIEVIYRVANKYSFILRRYI